LPYAPFSNSKLRVLGNSGRVERIEEQAQLSGLVASAVASGGASVRPRGSRTRREAVLEQLNRILDGIAYIYMPGRPGGFELPTLLGRPARGGAWEEAEMRELAHPEDLHRALRHPQKVLRLADGASAALLARMRRLGGDWRWISVREQVLDRTPDGEPRRILGFARDVTESRRLKEALQTASKALLNAETQERQRIARELHDSMAQHLVAIDLTLSRLERHSAGQLDPAIMADLRAAVAAAHRDARAFSYLLHPPELERLGLEETLRRFLEGFAARTGLEVRLEVEDALPPIGALGELSLFRIAQEALMNVHKHAAAKLVEVALGRAPEGVVLEIGDDGMGLDEAEVGLLMDEGAGGVGLAAMRARMRQIAGELELLPSPKGLKIRAVAPVEGDLPPLPPKIGR
jgi:signal transduction histidine kinase